MHDFQGLIVILNAKLQSSQLQTTGHYGRSLQILNDEHAIPFKGVMSLSTNIALELNTLSCICNP